MHASPVLGCCNLEKLFGSSPVFNTRVVRRRVVIIITGPEIQGLGEGPLSCPS